MLKIQRSQNGGAVVFALSGRLDEDGIALLQQVLNVEPDGGRIVLALQELKLVDRPGVIFLEQCETDGVELAKCPDYVRQWIQGVRDAR